MTAALRLLSAGSIRRGVTGVIAMFERATGVRVEADFTSAPKVQARVLANERADVVIASASVIDRLTNESRVLSGSRDVVGRTAMAVAARIEVTLPDLSSTGAFREAMLNVDLLAYNRGTSGIHAAMVLDRLELREPLGSRIREVQNGAEMFGLITSMPGVVVGLANITNIRDQIANGVPVKLAGLLPPELQKVTLYEVVVAAGANEAVRPHDFVKMFSTEQGKQTLASAGVGQG